MQTDPPFIRRHDNTVQNKITPVCIFQKVTGHRTSVSSGWRNGDDQFLCRPRCFILPGFVAVFAGDRGIA